MSISSGTRIGSYEITSPLGKGGMGEVYRARDLKLKREVAIKVLPEEFSRDTDRVGRFRREAEVLASLNHPNIAAIYNFEEAADTRFLVLELVEGDTLADRISRGPLAIEDALEIATHICDALEAAHDKGIVHRDLKPANVKIAADGKVKVLDFGLAKAMDADSGAANLSNSPTLTNSFGATNAGMILGTAAYMSPEQARGFAADRRSDIFAFGCVLYEMLTARQAFQGETVSDILASVLAREPDFTLLLADSNPKLVDVIRRCLNKNRNSRWHCAADLRAELQVIAAAPRVSRMVTEQNVVRRPLWKRAIPLIVSSILFAALAGTAAWNLKSPLPPAVVRFSIPFPENTPLISNSVGFSHDGTQIVYVANKRLYVRSIADSAARLVPGSDSEGVSLGYPTFSPDNKFIVYSDAIGPGVGTMKKISATGGVPVKLMEQYADGITWDTNGIVAVVIGLHGAEIVRVSPDGGKPSPLLTLKDGYILNPQVLPGEQAVLFTTGTTVGDWNKGRVVVQSLKSGERKTLIETGSAVRYVSTGHILYAVGGTLFAVRFDLRRLEVVGGAVPVIQGVWRNYEGSADYSVSDNGSLIYVPGPASTQTVAQDTIGLIERTGEIKTLAVPPGPYVYPRISPNGKSIAFGTDDGKDAIIYIYDLSGNTSMRKLTFVGANRFPVWSSDSQHVAFQSDREGDLGIFWQRADGTGNAERLTKPEKGIAHIPDSWSPAGGQFSFTEVKGDERAVWTFSLSEKKATLFASAPSSHVASSAFSPDGKWLAYHSDENKRYEVYVQPFPRDGTKYQISKDAQSHNPAWSPNGKELFFIPGPYQFLKVDLNTKPSFTFSNPAPLMTRFLEFGPEYARTYDITPDGKHLLGVVQNLGNGIAGTQTMQVVLNWFRELEQQVPVK